MSDTPALPSPHEATRLESDRDFRQALEAYRAAKARAPDGLRAAEPFRPLLRPPTALLCVVDDGQPEGAWLRLRADRTVIGRAAGDVVVPHDARMSGRHAEVVREKTAAGYRWLLADLGSRNGTFARVSNTLLRNDSELIVGRGRYRFESGGSAAFPPAEADAAGQVTRDYSGAAGRPLVPSLVELTPAGPTRRLTLTLPEYWIGRDAACAVVRPDDVLTSPRHARLFRDDQGQWRVENNRTVNGVWLRVGPPLELGGHCQFRLGEQRFVFRLT